MKFVDERIRKELRELATERCKVHSTGLGRDELNWGTGPLWKASDLREGSLSEPVSVNNHDLDQPISYNCGGVPDSSWCCPSWTYVPHHYILNVEDSAMGNHQGEPGDAAQKKA